MSAHQVALSEVKLGDYVRLKPSETAPVWVRGAYCRASKTFSLTKADDMNHEALRKPTTLVWVGFTY